MSAHPIMVRAATYCDDVMLADGTNSILIPIEDVDALIEHLQATKRQIEHRIKMKEQTRLWRKAA